MPDKSGNYNNWGNNPPRSPLAKGEVGGFAFAIGQPLYYTKMIPSLAKADDKSEKWRGISILTY